MRPVLLLAALLAGCGDACDQADARVRAKFEGCSIPLRSNAGPKETCDAEASEIAACEADCAEAATCDALDGSNADASITYASCLGLCTPQQPTT